MFESFTMHGVLVTLWLIAPASLLPGVREVTSGEPEVDPVVWPSEPQRVERFELVAEAAPEGDVQGVCEWRHRKLADGWVLERDLAFTQGELCLRHVERLTEETTRLVWREEAPGVGRSQIAEPLPAVGEEPDKLLVLDWVHTDVERETMTLPSGASFPLQLTEALRVPGEAPTQVQRYWPLSRSVEDLTVRTSLLSGAGFGRHARRLVELVREDGSLAARYLFDDDSLEGFQWQEGGFWARRASHLDFESMRRKLRVRPVEASASTAQGE